MVMFVVQLYLEAVYGYTTMLVECVVYEGYHRPDGEPVLTGYFAPDLAVMNYQAEMPLVTPLLPPSFDLAAYDTLDYKQRRKSVHKELVQNHAADLVVVGLMMFHSDARRWIKTDLGGYDKLYETLVPRMCKHLQFNQAVQADINSLRRAQYPDLPPDLRHVPSVAFHVRRTDKILGESKLYTSDRYVRQMVQVMALQNLQPSHLKVCFLATDDDSVHTEMEQALQEAGFTCRLFYTQPANYNDNDADSSGSAGAVAVRYQSEAGLVFLTEVSILVEATYFVGTFGSNVGALTAVLRGCPGRYNANHDFANSYGVDRGWFLP